jgi:hypothetical protein
LQDRQIIAESVNVRAMRMGDLKLIVPSTGNREVYDVERDPEERRNLYSIANAGTSGLDSAFDRWQQIIPRKSAAPSGNAQELRRLKSLGYIQ